MDQELKARIKALVQKRIAEKHVTKARGYVSTTDNGVAVSRIGISVYLESDNQVDAISKVLAQLSKEGKEGHPDPIIVDVFGTPFVVTGAQRSDYEETVNGKLIKNYSERPKVTLSDYMVGGNAEVSEEEVVKSIRFQQELRESQKNLKKDLAPVRKELLAVSDKEFDDLLS